MIMKFTTITTFVYLLLSVSFLTAFAAPLELRDVYVPKIVVPTKDTVWTVGQSGRVVWDNSNPPVNITNKIGEIYLRKGGLTTTILLAGGFDILLGHIDFVVPQVETGRDYQVVLFGDSGNFSPYFTIRNE